MIKVGLINSLFLINYFIYIKYLIINYSFLILPSVFQIQKVLKKLVDSRSNHLFRNFIIINFQIILQIKVIKVFKLIIQINLCFQIIQVVIQVIIQFIIIKFINYFIQIMNHLESLIIINSKYFQIIHLQYQIKANYYLAYYYFKYFQIIHLQYFNLKVRYYLTLKYFMYFQIDHLQYYQLMVIKVMYFQIDHLQYYQLMVIKVKYFRIDHLQYYWIMVIKARNFQKIHLQYYQLKVIKVRYFRIIQQFIIIKYYYQKFIQDHLHFKINHLYFIQYFQTNHHYQFMVKCLNYQMHLFQKEILIKVITITINSFNFLQKVLINY